MSYLIRLTPSLTLIALLGVSKASSAADTASNFPVEQLLRGTDALTEDHKTLETAPVVRFNWQKALPPVEPLFPSIMGPLETPALPPGITTLSAQTCNACHQEIHQQWQSSAHAKAWVDPIYQAALKATGNANACIHCHTPFTDQQQNLITGLHRGNAALPVLEPNESFDPGLQQEGVTCAVCHIRDGVIYGTRSLPDGRAPHPVAAHPDLTRASMCGACHQLAIPGAENTPYYDTLGEWSRSSFGQNGVSCQDCHMPYEMGGATQASGLPAPRRSHKMPGGFDDEMVNRALTIQLRPDKAIYSPGQVAKLSLKVLNTGAGHAVPTTAPFRQLQLVVSQKAEPDRVLKTLIIGREMSTTPPFKQLKDNRIQSDGGQVYDIELRIPKSTPTGNLEILVKVMYWAVPEETAKAHGLEREMVGREVKTMSFFIPIQ